MPQLREATLDLADIASVDVPSSSWGLEGFLILLSLEPRRTEAVKDKRYWQLHLVLSGHPHVHGFLDDDFIEQQCERRLKSHILKRLDNPRSSQSVRQHLPTLEERLVKLTSVTGYDRLGPLLRGAADWDQYQEALAQIDATLWFKEKNLLREIAPVLPDGSGNADILLCWVQEHVYCEVASFQSIAKAFEFRTEREKNRMQMGLRQRRQREPWKTEQDLENELQIGRAVRNLLDKTKRQLPADYPGVLALDTTKSGVFGLDVREIARRLFPIRAHVMLILLWSGEGNGAENSDLAWGKEIPTYCFVNSVSQFRVLAETMLGNLGLSGESVGT